MKCKGTEIYFYKSVVCEVKGLVNQWKREKKTQRGRERADSPKEDPIIKRPDDNHISYTLGAQRSLDPRVLKTSSIFLMNSLYFETLFFHNQKASRKVEFNSK